MSFESIHALDVSGTLAGEAERMATGDALGDRAAEAGVPLAWIGSTGGAKRSVVAARAEGNVFFGFVPENADVDVTLAGGGFVADVPAWDRAATLAGVLANAAAGKTAVLAPTAAVEKAPVRKKSVTFADQREERATESSGASFAFASGDWTVTLPWNPPDAGARALLLSLSAHASASVVVDVHLEPGSTTPAFDSKSWRADARADSATLALRETAKDVSGADAYAFSSSPVFEMRGFGCEVHSDGSEWHEGIAFDVAAGDVTLLVSRRRLARIQEAGRVLEAFGAESSAASAKTDARWTVSAAKPSTTEKRGNAETPFFASFPAVSSSLSLGVVGLLVLDDDRSGSVTNLGPSLLEGAVLGASASATFDPKERRASLTAEARTLLDALDREKGAWEPVVEPWRLRLGADASFHADGAPSKIDVTFTGVDALEITVGEAGAAAAAAARALGAGSESRRRRRFRARIGCTTPRTSPPSTSSTAWPRRERTTRAFAVSSRRERASPSSSREPKRAPRRDTRASAASSRGRRRRRRRNRRGDAPSSFGSRTGFRSPDRVGRRRRLPSSWTRSASSSSPR